MKSEEVKQINFKKPPFKGVFKSVKKELSDNYNRDITVEAVSQAYNRCDPIVVKLVKKEIESRMPNYDRSINEKEKARSEKENFENLIVENIKQVSSKMTDKQKQKMIDEAIKRLKKKLKIKVKKETDSELAVALGISLLDVEEWRKTGKFDLFIIKELIPDIRIDWLFGNNDYDIRGVRRETTIDELLWIAGTVAFKEDMKINITFEKKIR